MHIWRFWFGRLCSLLVCFACGRVWCLHFLKLSVCRVAYVRQAWLGHFVHYDGVLIFLFGRTLSLACGRIAVFRDSDRDASTLHRHNQEHHKNRRFHCPNCDISYIRKENLEKHLKKNHIHYTDTATQCNLVELPPLTLLPRQESETTNTPSPTTLWLMELFD